ncbi:MAG: hypothetical protein J6X12_11935 [Paludibacteraceae bacterium]|nr:hypothetical protein [Paludibacteraceae bacterium]
MAQISKALNNSELNWFRINLTKRKELDAFRNIIIDKVNKYNQKEDAESDEETDVDCIKRRYLFPSNTSNINGYYESIMSNIKFSCWVKCTEDELLEMLDELNDNQITADASRKSNSGVIRVVNETDVNTLNWIIKHAPQNLFRANTIPAETKHATLSVPGGVILEGELSKMRGNVNTDKFFFSVLGTDLFMVINKGDAEEVVDISQEIENAKKASDIDKANNSRQWMVLRVSRGSEQSLEKKIELWKKNNDSGVCVETYLPTYIKDIKRCGNIIGQRKALFCPGYLFIHTSIADILRIESDKLWDGSFISRLLVRQSMRKNNNESQALKISDAEMADFKFAVNSNLTNIALDAEDYVDNELVRYYNPGSPFNQKIGRVLHKGETLYLSFLPLGGIMNFTKAIKIESSQIRKLSNKELAELNE